MIAAVGIACSWPCQQAVDFSSCASAGAWDHCPGLHSCTTYSQTIVTQFLLMSQTRTLPVLGSILIWTVPFLLRLICYFFHFHFRFQCCEEKRANCKKERKVRGLHLLGLITRFGGHAGFVRLASCQQACALACHCVCQAREPQPQGLQQVAAHPHPIPVPHQSSTQQLPCP